MTKMFQNPFKSRHVKKAFLKYFIFLLPCAAQAQAQISFAGLEHLFTTTKSYVVPYTKEAPAIDGKLKDNVWQQAHWSDSFIDIEGSKKQKPAYNTKIKMLWNDSCLFIAAE